MFSKKQAENLYWLLSFNKAGKNLKTICASTEILKVVTQCH
jgi:hypothetical protein